MAARNTGAKTAPAKKKAKEAPKPDTLAAMLYEYEQQAARIADVERELKALKDAIGAVESQIFEHMRSQGIDGFKGEHTNVAVVTQRVPKVTDWDAFNAYVLKHKALDMLHRRVSSTAYFDRVNNGESVPGVVPESFMKLQFSKRKA